MRASFKGKATNPQRAKLWAIVEDFAVKRFNPASGVTETDWRDAIQVHNLCPDTVDIDLEGEIAGFTGDHAIISSAGLLHKVPLSGVKVLDPVKAVISSEKKA